MTDRSAKILTFGLSLYVVTTLVSMAAMSIGAGIALLALVVSLGGLPRAWEAIRRESARKPVRIYLWTAGALMGACILSLIVAKFAPVAYGGRISPIHLFADSAKLWYLFWPVPLLAGLRALPPAGRRSVLRAWFFAYALLSVIGIAQFWIGWPRPRHIPELMSHFHATMFLGFHLAVASIWIFPFFATLDLAYRTYKDGHPRLGLGFPAWVALSAAGMLVLFFTFSRTVWVALPVGLFLWALLALPRRLKIGVVIALVLALGGLSQLPSVQSRFTLFQGQYSVSTRAELWKANLAMAEARPLTGVGWQHNNELSGYYLMEAQHSNDVFSGHAHNNFLDVLGGTGALGLLAWLLWCGLVLWLARPGPGAQGPGLFCAWVVFQINGFTQVNFWDAKVTHQMVWIVALLLLNATARTGESWSE